MLFAAGFLHGWAITAGLAAAALPVAIHLLTRPRPRRMPLSTIRFVQELVQQRRARHRLRDMLVLLLRTLAVLMLAIAVARPLWGLKQPPPEESDAELVRIVVLDVSQSMDATFNGVRVFDRAKPEVIELLDVSGSSRANLVLAGATIRTVLDQASSNALAAHEAVDAARPLPERLDVRTLLTACAEIFSFETTADGGRRELVIVSDFQRSNWAAANFSVLPEDVSVRLQSVAPDITPDNAAVLSVRAAGRMEFGREARLEVEVANWSAHGRNLQVEVELGDAVYRLSGPVGARSRTMLSRDVMPQTDGWPGGTARLLGIDDAIVADNVRPCVLHVHRPPQIVLLTRQPEDMVPSSSYFIERALVPDGDPETAGRVAARVQRMHPGRIDSDVLLAADVVIVDQPGRLSNSQAHLLADVLRRRHGLLYVTSNDADAFNIGLLNEVAGSLITLPVEFFPPAAGAQRVGLGVSEFRRELPPFAVFGDSAGPIIAALRINGGLQTQRQPGGLEEDILATLTDRSAWIVRAATESGVMLVLNCDLRTSNIAASPLLVPLLGELELALLDQGQGSTETPCGEPFAIPLPGSPSASGLQIVGDARNVLSTSELVADSRGVLWRSAKAPAPSVFRVQQGLNTLAAVATAIPAEEADLRSLSADVFEQRLAGERSVVFRSRTGSATDEQDTWWTWFAIACLACIASECILLRTL